MSAAPNLNETDGRLARSERTKRQIVEAYLLLLSERPQIPTAAEIAKRAGYSIRTVYMHFSDVATLSVAACDYAIELGLSIPVGDKPDGDRPTRIRFQVEERACLCESWLSLWRMLMHYQGSVPDLALRVRIARALMYRRLLMMYRPELATLARPERHALLMGLESLTDFESWGRLREIHGLSFEQACDAWIMAIDRLLPATPGEAFAVAADGARRATPSPSLSS